VTAPGVNFLYSNSVSRLCDEATSIEFALDESLRRLSWFCTCDAVLASITCHDYEPASVYIVVPIILQIRSLSPNSATSIRDGFEERAHRGCRSFAWTVDLRDQSAAETMAISA
jgi:hypothetical protein